MIKPRKKDSESSRAKSQPDAETHSPVIAPRSELATNLLVTSILVRGASSLLHKKIENKVTEAVDHAPGEAVSAIDGRTLISTLGLYGASKLASRSPIGFGMVAGGLVLKALYDRGKARQRRQYQQSEGD